MTTAAVHESTKRMGTSPEILASDVHVPELVIEVPQTGTDRLGSIALQVGNSATTLVDGIQEVQGDGCKIIDNAEIPVKRKEGGATILIVAKNFIPVTDSRLGAIRSGFDNYSIGVPAEGGGVLELLHFSATRLGWIGDRKMINPILRFYQDTELINKVNGATPRGIHSDTGLSQYVDGVKNVWQMIGNIISPPKV